MFSTDVSISCILGVENLITVVAFVTARKMNIFNVIQYGILPLSSLSTQDALKAYNTQFFCLENAIIQPLSVS